MTLLPRRQFLAKTSTLAAGLGVAGVLSARGQMQVRGANEAIRLGIAGLNSKGEQHLQTIAKMADVRITALCDADTAVLDRALAKLREAGQDAAVFQDYRKMIERPDVDAVLIAAPNHWHALMTIWACQAGKDVYVEKPVSHDIFEGTVMAAAAQRYGRIVQAGTQTRSDPGMRAALPWLREGNLGKILWVHGLWYKLRGHIGRVTGPQPIPSTVNYDLFQGPAPMKPLMRERLHYDWHWFWDTGNGDMANLGVHLLDATRMLLADENPRRVRCYGGRFALDDDAETPNVQVAVMDFPSAPCFLELRGLPEKPGTDRMDAFRQVRDKIVVQCEHGYFAGGQSGGLVYDNEGKRIQDFRGDGGRAHAANFFAAMRSRKTTDLNCPLEQGVLSAEICHLANLSYRAGRPAGREAILEASAISSHGEELLGRVEQHLTAHGVDWGKTPLTLGEWVHLDRSKVQVESADAHTRMVANALLRPAVYRAPFTVPELG